MSPFLGFKSGDNSDVPVPVQFFTELIEQIDDAFELKVCLKIFHILGLQEGKLRYVLFSDLAGEEALMRSKEGSEEHLRGALESLVRRGVVVTAKDETETFYFLNSPEGRAALEAMSKGAWHHDQDRHLKSTLSAERPNIFSLYERNIGPLTPMIADILEDAEKQYSPEWIEDAVKLAITKNVRNWKYIEAILRSWKEKGRYEKDQRSSAQDRRRDSEGEFADVIIH